MKKGLKKFTKLLVLMAMIFSDLMSPISVLAEAIGTPNKGDVGKNGIVTNNGNSATVSVGSLNNAGDVAITKTVSKTETDGRYKIEFEIKGREVETSTAVTKPVYVVVVFDRSGSMICDSSRGGYSYVERYNPDYVAADGTGIACEDSWDGRFPESLIKAKWENAVQGTINFSKELARLNNTNISLVTFSNKASSATDFKHGVLEASEFKHPYGSTNFTDGLDKAIEKLDTITDDKAQKYIVVIGDGKPTVDANNLMDKAYEAKNTKGINIFSIGYGVSNDSDAKDVLKKISSNTTITKERYGYGYRYSYSYEDKGFYKETGTSDIASGFETIFEEIVTLSAGTKAVLIDNLGGQFRLTEDSTLRTFVSEEIENITEDGAKISFYVDIDKDSTTGWHDTNNGFKLEYIAADGSEKVLSCDENPQVYWVQNTYKYVVNYYKDSIKSGNLIKSEDRYAPNGTVINKDNVDKDKYLPTGYEFNSVTPSSITITNNGEVKVINVLYTIKKFSYVVNYYYDDVKVDTITEVNIPYGTRVIASDYYLDESDIREGYSLDTGKSSNGTYTITDNGVVIDIYYTKNSYGYFVNYFFNNEKGFTNNSDAIYGDKITASSKWLSNTELSSRNKSDYFLDPNKEIQNNSEITIGTDTDDNVLNIYYINTNFDNNNETIAKVANTRIVSSSNDSVSYSVNYNTKINNVRNGDVVKTTIVDTLPGAIILDSSDLKGGIYNSEDNTITWVKSYNISEYFSIYNVNEVIDYTVKYVDYLSSNGNNLINSVHGTTTVSHEGLDDKSTSGMEDSASVPVSIMGTVNVYYKDANGNDIAPSEALGEALAGKAYSTSSKDITGYTLRDIPSNKDGNYIEGNIDVIYYYTKNDGNITNNELVKEGPLSVSNVNDTFSYTLKYNGKIEDYVGKATLTIIDNLPLEGFVISKDNSCTFSNNTITCTKEYDVNGTLVIDEKFDFEVKYTNITSNKIVNSANSKLTLENIEVTDDDDTETEVYKGTVTATYKDTNGNSLSDDVSNTGFGGTDYSTEAKSFYGYSLREVPSNKDGKYIANSTIVVNYVYTKNNGDVTLNDVNKSQNNIITSIDSEYKYVLSYSGKIENYVGDVTLVLSDTLPYNAVIISKDNKCLVDGKNITCTDVYTVDEEHQNINASFDIVLKYTNVGSEVKNVVNSKLIYGNNFAEDSDEVIDVVPSGKVTATYKDTDGNSLSGNVSSTGLVGEDYSTLAKDFFGYTLREMPNNSEGVYTKEDITVNYVYVKNNGDIEEEDVVKDGPNTIDSVDGVFDYNITASGNIKNYVGSAKLTVVDKLPYVIDEDKSSIDNSCKYDKVSNTITCIKDYTDIKESDYVDGVYEIYESFDLKLVFIGIDSVKVVNKAMSTIELDGNSSTTETETVTEVYNGTVTATYKDTDGNSLSDDISSTGLGGTDYSTEAKSFYGYTLREVPSNKDGKYIANSTIVVNYVYTKNEGTSTEEVYKNGLEVVGSINDTFNYTITYNAEIRDYVGKATLTITDILPYEIDIEKSNIGNNCKYNKDNNTIVCKYEMDNSFVRIDDINSNIDDNRYIVFNIVEDFELYYINIDNKEITNKVLAELTYGDVKKTTDDDATTLVEEGNVIVNYVTKDGTKLTDSITLTGLVGTSYETTQKDFDKYSFVYVEGDVEGLFDKELKEVTYVYDLTILPPQTGVETNIFMYINYIVTMIGVVVALRTYKTIKNN